MHDTQDPRQIRGVDGAQFESSLMLGMSKVVPQVQDPRHWTLQVELLVEVEAEALVSQVEGAEQWKFFRQDTEARDCRTMLQLLAVLHYCEPCSVVAQHHVKPNTEP